MLARKPDANRSRPNAILTKKANIWRSSSSWQKRPQRKARMSPRRTASPRLKSPRHRPLINTTTTTIIIITIMTKLMHRTHTSTSLSPPRFFLQRCPRVFYLRVEHSVGLSGQRMIIMRVDGYHGSNCHKSNLNCIVITSNMISPILVARVESIFFPACN